MGSVIRMVGIFIVATILCAVGAPVHAQAHFAMSAETISDDSTPRRAWNALRHALANNDSAAVAAALTPDAEIYDLDETGARVRARGAAASATLLERDTGSEAGVGVALLPSRSVRVDDVIYAAETLPRVYDAPSRLSIYRTHGGRVLRVWRFPAVPRNAPAALDDVIAYREAWSAGRWAEVASHHAPDVKFLRIVGPAIGEFSTVAERKRCYESGFRRWRTLNTGSQYHPQEAGCDGGPITVERGVAVGPYVATVEKRMWASGVNEWSLRMFLYVADGAGIRRVIYVLGW